MAMAQKLCGAATLTRGTEAPMHDLNTTPLIDVMLCLLVMMILSIPAQTHSVKVELPFGGENLEILPINTITITRDGVVLWNAAPVTYAQLQRNLGTAQAMLPSPELQFEPDAEARYVIVDTVLAMIRRSGAENMGFVGNEAYAREF
ncbi:MAG: biopolymer transporter ExbD [Sphingopyxis sp.]